MNAHDIHALSGAYAVDALDDLERARFEEHLAQCAACRAEVADLVATSTLLSELTDTPPPPALRDRVLAEIRTVRPLPPLTPGAGQAQAPARPRWRRLAAAAAAVAVLGGGTVLAEQVLDSSSQEAPSAIDRVLAAADAQNVSVDLPGDARMRLVRSVTEGRAVLITNDLPAAPPGKVYELWLQNRAGKMVAAGLMKGAGSQRFLLDGDAARALGAGVTVEPASGSQQPTTAPIALFDFSTAT